MFDFGLHLKELRKLRNVTQRQLANDIGASERGIQQYELGERKPNYDMLIALANYFGVSIDYLVGRAGDAASQTEQQARPRSGDARWEALLKLWEAAAPEERKRVCDAFAAERRKRRGKESC